MSDVLDPRGNIFEGFWKDWSRGSVWGLTWTLCPTQATILTNALAVFVTIAGIRLWTIIRYLLSQIDSHTDPVDLTPHVRDRHVILRNAGSDLATAWLMLKLAYTSRRQSTGQRSAGSISIGLFATSYAILFWTAGIFSNKAISASSSDGTSRVLSRSNECGVWNQTYDLISNDPYFSSSYEFELYSQKKAKTARDVQLSLEYAQACYPSSTLDKSMSSTCNTMKTPSLNWTMRSESCPFDTESCRKDSRVVLFDTSELNSHTHLGINAPSTDRLTYQRQTTCAALDDTGYITNWNSTTADISRSSPAPETVYAWYGPSLYKNTNWTYAYSNFASFYDSFTPEVTLPYQLEPQVAFAPADPVWSGPGDFNPVPEIAQTQADLFLLFLSFTGMYTAAVDDPWFSAHREEIFPDAPAFLQSRYSRDRPISTLGCTVQHQFCTSNNTCTGFGGFDQIQNNSSFNNALTAHQNATFDRMLRAVMASELGYVVQYLQQTMTPLLASSQTVNGASGAVVSTQLPNDQWIVEMEFLHSVALAHFQRSVLQWATGQVAAEPQYLEAPVMEQDKWFCNNMIIQSIVYQSFSLVAIILIVVFGTLVISISLTVEDIGGFLRKRLNRPSPGRTWAYFDMLSHRTPIRTRFNHDDIPNHTPIRRQDSNEGLRILRTTPIPEIRRVSSPTLPPEDRGLRISKSPTNYSRPRRPSPIELLSQPTRNSGMAISLNNLDIDSEMVPSESQRSRRAPLRIIPLPPPLLISHSNRHGWNRNDTVYPSPWV